MLALCEEVRNANDVVVIDNSSRLIVLRFVQSILRANGMVKVVGV